MGAEVGTGLPVGCEWCSLDGKRFCGSGNRYKSLCMWNRELNEHQTMSLEDVCWNSKNHEYFGL